MDDQCQTPTDIPPADIFSKATELAEKMGAGQECKKAAKTDYSNASTSMGVSGSASGYGAEVKAEAHAQASYIAGSNSMAESGCGTLLITAQKVINNSKKINCIMQKSAQSSNTNISMTNSMKIGTVPLTPQEIENKKADVTKWQQSEPKFIEPDRKAYISELPSISDLKSLGLITNLDDFAKYKEDGYKKYVETETDSFTKRYEFWKEVGATINELYDRSANFDGVDMSQSISGNIKTKVSLSTADSAQVENLSKQIASTVAQAAIEQKSGLNALSPNLKSITDTTSENTENLSNTNINSKVQNTSVNIKIGNIIEIRPSGKLNMKNIIMSQNIDIDVATEILIASAVSAGLKSASEMSSNSSVSTALKQESAGVDDLVRAQGEANAAAIQAAQITLPATSGAGIIGAIIVLAILFNYDRLPPNMKFAIDIVLGVIVLGLLFCVYILYQNLTALLRYIRKLMGSETPDDKAVLFKRPLELYNKLWKEGYGFTTELTNEDLLNTTWTITSNPDQIALENPDAPITDGQIKEAMQNKYDLTNDPGAYEEDILFCYMDGIIPLSLKKLKTKVNKDLTDDEIGFLWENVSKCDPSMFTKIIQGNYRSMKNIDEILAFMKKTYYDSSSTKKPSELSEYDIRFLWKYVGCIDNDFIFNKIVIEKDTLQKYTNLTSMDAVLAQLKKYK